MALLAFSVGIGKRNSLSNRPGRRSAGSMESMRLVAPITTTFEQGDTADTTHGSNADSQPTEGNHDKHARVRPCPGFVDHPSDREALKQLRSGSGPASRSGREQVHRSHRKKLLRADEDKPARTCVRSSNQQKPSKCTCEVTKDNIAQLKASFI